MTRSLKAKLIGVAFIVIVTLSATVLAIITTEDAGVSYDSRIKILVDQPKTMGGADGISNVNKILQLIPTYTQIIEGTPIAEKVSARLDDVSTEEVLQSITAIPIEKTQVFTVTTRSSNPQDSMDIATAAGEAFIEQMNEQQNDYNVEPEDRLEFSIIEPADNATLIEPQRSRNIFLVAVASLIISTGCVLVFFNARQG